jgi:hypothetical protein
MHKAVFRNQNDDSGDNAESEKMRVLKTNGTLYSILFLLILFHSICNFFWIKKDCNSGGCDVYNHSYLALILKQNLERILLNDTPLTENLRSAYQSLEIGAVGWPRLVHAIAAVVCFDSEDELFCFRYSNIIFFSLLIASVFLIGRKMCSPGAGLIAAAFISFYPVVFGMSRKFGLDFPAMSMVMFVLFLLMGDPFNSNRRSILLGVSIGMCMLIKVQCVLFIGGPFLYVILYAIRHTKNRPYLKNVIVAAVIALFIALIWWHRLFSYEGIREIRFHFLSGAVPEYKDLSLLDSMSYFIIGIYENMSSIFFGIFVIGLIASFQQIRRKEFIILLLSFLPAYFFYSFLLPHTNLFSTRYLLPAYGSFAVISVVGMMNVSSRRFIQLSIRGLMIILIIMGIGQFFQVSYSQEAGYQSQWFHSWKTNNHKMAVDQFNTTIQAFGLPKNRIAIIENPGFAADPVKLLCLYFMSANKKNEVYLSCDGDMPSVTREKFLLEAKNMDFVITTSRNSDLINFSGLDVFSQRAQKEMAAAAIERFRSFKIVGEAKLLPENVYLFLLSRH